jgi:hypothetical protein
MDDLPLLIRLQEIVKSMLTSDDHLEPLSKAEFSFILSGNGLMIGVFTGDELIAFRALLIPELDDEHLGIDTGLARDELTKVIYSEVSNVHPKYRGNGLQTYMGEIIMENIDTSRFHYVCATVAPFNIPSIKDKLSLGMEIVALKRKYGEKLRYIFFKRLVKSETTYDQEEVSIKMEDMEKQRVFLRNGYRGIAIKKVNGEWSVQYCK